MKLHGFGVKEVICKIMKPVEYRKVMENPRMYADFEKNKDIYMKRSDWKFSANEKAAEVFDSIWRDMWGIW